MLRARCWPFTLAAVHTLAFATSYALASCRTGYVRITAVVTIAALAVGGEELREQLEESTCTDQERVKYSYAQGQKGANRGRSTYLANITHWRAVRFS